MTNGVKITPGEYVKIDVAFSEWYSAKTSGQTSGQSCRFCERMPSGDEVDHSRGEVVFVVAGPVKNHPITHGNFSAHIPGTIMVESKCGRIVGLMPDEWIKTEVPYAERWNDRTFHVGDVISGDEYIEAPVGTKVSLCDETPGNNEYKRRMSPVMTKLPSEEWECHHMRTGAVHLYPRGMIQHPRVIVELPEDYKV